MSNALPALNDMTFGEMDVLLQEVCKLDHRLATAKENGSLSICHNGQGSPCLDLRSALHWGDISGSDG